MCGICGEFTFGVQKPIQIENIKRMMNRLVHRGPDDEGLYISGTAGLGFRRLSIIDIEGGHQPMSDAEESTWVVFNGEIYNYRELRKELESDGYRFRTQCDTEVIVYGYKKWGTDLLHHLNGMFALAVWDNARRTLMLARDPMGIKLLYYHLSEERMAFASEIKPLLASDAATLDIDPIGMALFLRYRYTPSPYTVLKDVRKLAPGTRMIIQEGSKPIIERWWTFRPEPFERMPKPAEAEAQLIELYRCAIKRQLMSDVPLGLLLSGGVDSGLLLALMKEQGASWNTYSVGYGKSFKGDELSSAARTAKLFGVPNVSLELSRTCFEATLPMILSALEEPVAASSVVPMYHVCQRAREDVKVAFVGQGPDELFGGYTRHLGVQYGTYWRALPKWLRRSVASAHHLYPRAEWVRRATSSLDTTDRLERYKNVFSLISEDVIAGLLREEVFGPAVNAAAEALWTDLRPLMERTDELGGFQFLEVRASLPDELLMYADKMSMANSLEVRVPFLDQDIVEFTERLDASMKVRHGSGKWLHRRVCKRFLPPEIIQRKKQGFAVNVVDDWLRKEVSSTMDDVLLDRDSRIFEYLDSHAVARLLRQHKQGESDNHKILFSFVALEYSLRSYLEWSKEAVLIA